MINQLEKSQYKLIIITNRTESTNIAVCDSPALTSAQPYKAECIDFLCCVAYVICFILDYSRIGVKNLAHIHTNNVMCHFLQIFSCIVAVQSCQRSLNRIQNICGSCQLQTEMNPFEKKRFNLTKKSWLLTTSKCKKSKNSRSHRFIRSFFNIFLELLIIYLSKCRQTLKEPTSSLHLNINSGITNNQMNIEFQTETPQ